MIRLCFCLFFFALVLAVYMLLWELVEQEPIKRRRAISSIDSSQLIDLPNFEYLMTLPACAPNVEALIMVPSAPGNRDKREVIRNTWGSVLKGTPLRLIFLLAAVDSEQLQRQLEQENARHGDLVQGNFRDDYHNMTYKHVMAFKWFLSNCERAQLLIKVDDDMFLNTPVLLQYWRNAQRKSTPEAAATNNNNNFFFNAPELLFRRRRDLLLCERKSSEVVSRATGHKWRVDYEDYPAAYYPAYCSGYVIIYSADVVLRLHEAAQQRKPFWIDDVYITGMIAPSVHINISTWYAYDFNGEGCAILVKSNSATQYPIYFINNHYQALALWQMHLKSQQSSASFEDIPNHLLAFECSYIDFA